jgi:hypothetical protein
VRENHAMDNSWMLYWLMMMGDILALLKGEDLSCRADIFPFYILLRPVPALYTFLLLSVLTLTAVLICLPLPNSTRLSRPSSDHGNSCSYPSFTSLAQSGNFSKPATFYKSSCGLASNTLGSAPFGDGQDPAFAKATDPASQLCWTGA